MANHFSRHNRASFADEHEKGRLKCILSVVRIVKQSLTHAKDHGPVPMDNGFECRFFSPRKKRLEQLAVRHGLAIFHERDFANLTYRPA